VAAVNGVEFRFFLDDAELVRKSDHASASVPAHTARVTVGIEVNHVEIQSSIVLEENQAVSTYAKMAVTNSPDECRIMGKRAVSVINHDKIVSCTLVFEKWNGQYLYFQQI